QIIRIMRIGKSVDRPAAPEHRELKFMLKNHDIYLIHKHHWPDHRKDHSNQIGLRRKGIKASLKKEGEQHGFYNIILVMGISYLIAAHFLHFLIQCALTHLGT